MQRTILVLFLLPLSLSACSGVRRDSERYSARWTGTDFDKFVSQYGPAASDYVLDNGKTAYLWNSGPSSVSAPDYAISRIYGDYSYKEFGGAGNINLLCEVQLVVGRDGVIEQFNIMRDTPGARIGSRCREVFK